MMHVCLLTDADAFAGTERHMLDLAIGLREAGVSVRVACPDAAPLAHKSRAAGLEVTAIEKRGLVGMAAIAALRRLLCSGEVDIVHAHNGRTALAAAIAVRAAGRGRCVTTQHFLEPNHVRRGGVGGLPARLAHRWVDAHTDRVIAVSESVRHAMLGRGEASDEKITVVPNGLRIDRQNLVSSSAVRQELGLTDSSPLIVCVARLEPEKDVAILLAAMQTVLRIQPEARAVVCGEGSEHGTLTERLHTLGIAHAVTLLGFREDAHAFIQSADVFVLPSRAEPFGLVLLEAMALGRPVIATDAGGPREVVKNGVTGRLVPPGLPGPLAAAILELVTRPEECRRMGRAGRSRYQRLYTVERMATDTVAVYRAALSR